MAKFKGGDRVTATEDIYSKGRLHDKPFLCARKGELMVVRSASPLEVSSYKNTLFAFDVHPHQIVLTQGD